MGSKKTSDAQIKAIKEWQSKNKERSNYLKKKSTARSFINKNATLEDLEELKELISEREISINKEG